MFLKSVEIFGFKSFADRTRIEFQDGISALLGPNGCGKSNVVDAIKWVVGEQSSKSLRAEKMEAVIFNGTATRKKLNVAEVILTISNENNLLPLDVAEVSVKRRLFRSGESEYYINETPAKLKDVRELFMDTGIGKSAYSVMEQGRISQILSNRPEERRYIFEEAAGITKFKARRIEAENKLKATTENMYQVENILNEVKKSHDNLKKQSEKTQKYRELNHRIFELELDKYLLRLKGLKEGKFQKEGQLKELRESLLKVQQEIATLTSYIDDQMGAVNTMQSQIQQAHSSIFAINVKKQNIDEQIALYKEQITNIDQQIATKVAKEEALSARRQALQEDISKFEDVLYEFEKLTKSAQEDIDVVSANINSSEERIADNEMEIADMNKNARDAENTKEQLALEIRELSGDIVAQLDESLQKSSYSASVKQKTQEELLHHISVLKVQLNGALQILVDAEVSKLDSSEGLKKLAVKSKEGFESAISELKMLEAKANGLIQLIPSFIDDFIAPEGIITRKHQIENQIQSLIKKIESCRDRVDDLVDENSTLNGRIKEYREKLSGLKENQIKVEKQRLLIESQLDQAAREASEKKREIDEVFKEIEIDRQQQNQFNMRIEDAHSTKNTLIQEENLLNKELKNLQQEIAKNTSEKNSKEKSLNKLHQEEIKTKEDINKIELGLVGVNSDIDNCYSYFRDRHARDLKEFEERMYEINTPLDKINDYLSKTRENLKNLGSVNMMAPEEYQEVKERYDFLNNQLEDLKRAKEDLNQITQQITTESTELFIRTFKQISKNFHQMFRRLFGMAGRGELQLTDPNDVLNSGVDILAQPPGKNLENIALLSGGEKSMTAVALLLATYQVRPAPFCILDEIDAALDEANIGRFVNVLVEFAQKSQFIVITHNKKTVTGAKSLLGVTMQESGVSTVISVRLASGENQDEADESSEEFFKELDEKNSEQDKLVNEDKKEG